MTSFDLLAHPVVVSTPKRILWSGWIGHIPFGMFLVDQLRPRLLIELGTHNGTSYCAFCQSISELKLETRSFAVDTWKGDSHTGSYGEEVYSELKHYHDPLYSNFSTLMRSTFDNASRFFKPLSIDLLHIDGCHDYESVRHDFETWLPKMSRQGVILFHDISVTTHDFGVHQLWNELKLDYKYFELPHSFGLGLLVVGEQAEDMLNCLLKCNEQENLHIKELFRQLGRSLELEVKNSNLEQNLETSSDTIEALEKELFAFYELGRNPLVRVVRGWKRYGLFGLMGKIAKRSVNTSLLSSNMKSSQRE